MSTSQSRKSDRRTFLLDIARIGAGAIAVNAILPRVMHAGDGPIATVTLAEQAALKTVGGSVMIDSAKGPILIIRSGENSWSVLDPICPHKQCKVKVTSPTLIQCPCHHSAYGIDGTYQSGPAKRSLSAYAFTIKDGVMTISAP